MKRTLPAAVLLTVSIGMALAPLAFAAVGTRAPEFTLPSAPGGPSHGRFRLADHVGQGPVVVLFWATWCQPCMQELPVYQRLYQQYGGRLTVVGIALDSPDSMTEVGPTARQLGLTFPIVTDLDTTVTSQYNPRRSAPFSVWIDRNGVIQHEADTFQLSMQAGIESGIARLMRAGPAAH